MVLGVHVVLSVTEPDFLKKFFFPKNGKYGPKGELSEFTGKFVINFF